MRWILLLVAASLGVFVGAQGDVPAESQPTQPALDQAVPEAVSFPEAVDPTFPSNGETVLDDINWNETVDYLLHLTNNRTLHKGRDEVVVPDIHEEFTRKVGPVTLRGEFTAREGHLKGLSHVRRTGDVTVVRRGTAITMTCLIGLENVRLDYNHYRVKVHRGPSMSGSIVGTVKTNSVRVTATMNVTDTSCTTTVDDVKVVELSGLKIRVERLGPPLDSLLSRITTWLTRVFREDVHEILEKGLTSELTKGLERSRCEKYASHFIFVEPK